MATPGQLVQTVADMLGVPAETVTNYDRVLSESGMRSKSGRGRGAAKVTAQDAAYLLIAILGSPIAGASVKEAANTCRRYGSLPVLAHVLGTHNFEKAGLKMLDGLPKKHTLHDGISALVNSAAKGEHYFIRGAKRQQWTDRRCIIRLTGPRPWAEILAETSFGERAHFARRVYSGQNLHQINKDLRQERNVTYRTIRALGSLLSSGA